MGERRLIQQRRNNADRQSVGGYREKRKPPSTECGKPRQPGLARAVFQTKNQIIKMPVDPLEARS
jgi:hypothetical protein